MIYEKEFKECKNKKEFMTLLQTNHKMKRNSAERRWYQYKKEFGNIETYTTEEIKEKLFDKNKDTVELRKIIREEIIKFIDENGKDEITNNELVKVLKNNTYNKQEPEYNYLSEEKEQPSYRQKLLFEDLKKYLLKQNKEYYKKNGINQLELNWLEDEGML